MESTPGNTNSTPGNISGFKLVITDFDKFVQFVKIIRGMDDNTLRQLTEALKASNDKVQAAVNAAPKA